MDLFELREISECNQFTDEQLEDFLTRMESQYGFNEVESADVVRGYMECFGSHYLTDLDHVIDSFHCKGIENLVLEDLTSKGVPKSVVSYINFEEYFDKEFEFDFERFEDLVFRNV